MVSMLALSVVEHGFEHSTGQIKDLSNWCLLLLCYMQHHGARAKTGWFRMC
jgi:hypothetical protein